MKKFFLFVYCSYLIFLGFENQVFSYELNTFYSTIAENTKEYDSLIFSTGIKGKDGIATELNNRSGTSCFIDSFTQDDLKQMVLQGQLLIDKIDDSCKGEDGSISIDLQTKLIQTAKQFNNEMATESKNTTETIQQLTESSLYADGNLENSPFDLMHDIQQLDEIIFERSEEIEYKATKNTNLGDIIKDKLKEKIKDNAKKQIREKIKKAVNICKLGGTCDTDTYIDKLIADIKKKQKNHQVLAGITSTQACPVDNSGLTDITENIIKNSIASKQHTSPNVSIGDNGYTIKNNDNKALKIQSNYKKKNDNSIFPCNDFFCVDVKFNTYNHKLLGGWTREYPSIEFLLKRANNHLKPIVNGSLVQSKMTLNNFELGLKDINLAESFHMGLHVTSKPVPILDIQGEEKEIYNSDKKNNTSPVYALDNQLHKYYTAGGLDFDSPNDLSLLLGYQAEKISTENAKGLSPEEAVADIREYEANIQKNYDSIEVIKNEIHKKVHNEGLTYLEEQFKEVEVMNHSVYQYVSSLDSILTQFSQTPVDTGTN